MLNSFVFCCLCFLLLVVFADAVKSVSVMAGDSVILRIDTEIQTHAVMKWRFGNESRPIAIIKSGTVRFLSDGPDGRFRDRLKLDSKTGTLTIRDTRTTDSGLYQFSGENIYSFNVSVNAPPSTPTSHPTSNPSSGPPSGSPHSPDRFLILLISAAAGSLLLLVAVGIICIYRKQRTTDQHAETREEEITYADPTFYKRKAQKSSAKQEDDVVYAGVVHRR